MTVFIKYKNRIQQKGGGGMTFTGNNHKVTPYTTPYYGSLFYKLKFFKVANIRI